MNKLIKTKADYEFALKRVDTIFDAKPGTPDGDELELLVTLIELYEEKHFPMDLPDPITAIKFRMEQQNLKQKDLVPYLGSESKVSEVLSGKRALSLTMIRKLVNGLGIPAEVLLQEPGAQLPSEDLVTGKLDVRDQPAATLAAQAGAAKKRPAFAEALAGRVEDGPEEEAELEDIEG